jgi:hypothetical protein
MLLLSAAISAGIAQTAGATDYSAWSYYRTITITPTGLSNAVAGFPLLVRLTSSDSAVFSQSQSSGYDVRFTGSDGSSDLSFQRVAYNQTGRAAEFWVLIPSVAVGTTALRMYWGNSGAGDVSNASAVFSTSNNFQGVWHLQSAPGSNDTDVTANAQIALPTNAPTNVAGVCGAAAKRFDGSTQFYTVQNSATGPIAFPSGGPYTISFWANFNATTATQHLLTKASGTGPFTGQYFIALTTAGFRFGEVISGATQKSDYPTADLTTGQWVYVTCIRRSTGVTDTNIRLYVNGALAGTPGNGAATGTYETTLNVTFGKDANTADGNYFNGSLDEIQMSNADRGDDWVRLSYQTQNRSAVTFGSPVTQALAPPVLLSPVNNAAAQPLSLTLSWNSSVGATGYSLQIATSAAFSATLFGQAGLTATSEPLAALSYATTYYWQVMASNASASGNWSGIWSFTTAGFFLGVPQPALPANGAINQMVPLQVTWNGVSGALSYALQVSADSAFGTTIISLTGLTALSDSVTGLANNVTYYWRVAAANAGGSSSWSGVSSFTTILAGPAVPQLLAPANNALNQTAPVVLYWSSSANAASYGLQVSTDMNFNTTTFGQIGLTADSAAVSGFEAGFIYYWRTNAVNVSGMSAWSATWNFSTAEGGPPASPALLLPANGATGQKTQLILTWGSVANATSYGVLVADDSDFATTVFSGAGLTDTTVTVTGLAADATYHWKANATDNAGTGVWSATWHFSTSSPSKHCGCGSDAGLAMIPPVLFRVAASRKRKKARRAA